VQISASYLSSLTTTLNEITTNEQSLTNELSSGSRVNAISDDPVAVGQNVGLSNQLSQDVNYKKASDTAGSLLQVTDSALGSVVSQLTQAISLSTQGISGTENGGDISSVMTQLASLRDEVVSLANTTFQGTYIFSGTKGTTEPFSVNPSTDPETVTYQGDSTGTFLSGPDGSKVQITFPGNQIFQNSSTNVLGTLNQLISDFKNGNTTGAQQLTNSLTTTISFIGQQRTGVDDSTSQLTDEQNQFLEQSTQLTVQQTALMQADIAQVATALSSSETQQTGLEDAIAALEKQGTLFQLITT
jgi:flagellar hook-associated protein 3 FlgL